MLELKNEQLYDLLTANDNELLMGYETYLYNISDLKRITNSSSDDLRKMIYHTFSDSVKKRLENKKVMEKQIEHYINMGFPIDFFDGYVQLLHHLSQVKSLQRKISRLIDDKEIYVEVPPITLYRFKNIIKRLQIKRDIVENMKLARPIALKEIAKKHNVSENLIFTINRQLDLDNPRGTPIDGKVGEKVEFLYDIHCKLKSGETMTSIQALYNTNIDDVRMIKQLFSDKYFYKQI